MLYDKLQKTSKVLILSLSIGIYKHSKSSFICDYYIILYINMWAISVYVKKRLYKIVFE